MSTTTIRIERSLRTRVRSAARHAGTSPHNFMIDAIEEKTRETEERQEFRDEATQRLTAIAASGRTVPWKEMRNYLQKRVSGAAATAPKGRKLTRP